MVRIILGLIIIILGMIDILLSIYDTQTLKKIMKMNIKDKNAIKKCLKYKKISRFIEGTIICIVGLIYILNLLVGTKSGLIVSFTFLLSRIFECILYKKYLKY